MPSQRHKNGHHATQKHSDRRSSSVSLRDSQGGPGWEVGHSPSRPVAQSLTRSFTQSLIPKKPLNKVSSSTSLGFADSKASLGTAAFDSSEASVVAQVALMLRGVPFSKSTSNIFGWCHVGVSQSEGRMVAGHWGRCAQGKWVGRVQQNHVHGSLTARLLRQARFL